jgi:hypothetical protein
MTTLVTADDKRRIILRGVRKGQKLLVQQDRGGWRIVPAPDIRSAGISRNRREWSSSRRTLDEHLQSLADAGLRIERAENAKQPVPPCRF